MGVFQDEFDRVIQEMFCGRDLLRRVIRRAADKKGCRLTDAQVDALVNCIEGHDKSTAQLEVEVDGLDSGITIDLRDGLEVIPEPNEIETVVAKAAIGSVKEVSPSYLQALIENAPETLRERRANLKQFEERLYEQWRDGLDHLEMLVMIAQEAGQVFVEELDTDDESKTSEYGSPLTKALLRLHARACRFASEVICLLKSGYADGANARWRSLHEIAVTSLFLTQHKGDVAERYLDHAAIERYDSAKEYERHCAVLGFKPLDAQELDELRREADACIRKYGDRFKRRYGWAAEVLGNNNPSFVSIEESIDMSQWRPFYALACKSIHSGSQSLEFSLTVPLGSDPVLNAGASNVGLCDPGQQTAISLMLTTICLMTTRPNIDHLVICECMSLLCGEISKKLFESHEVLQREINGND